ncbi:MAG: hypothetical protein ACOY5F_08405 [Pseudomonadota bacterium]
MNGRVTSIILAAMTATYLAAQAPGHAQSVPGAAAEMQIEGTVAEVFGARFVIDSENGRLLVDPNGAAAALPVAPGDRVTALGLLRDRTLTASRIARSDGSVLYQAAPPKPSAASLPEGRIDIEQALAGLQLTPTGPPVRKKHHTEILARMQDGRNVYVSFDRLGRIDEIEDASHDKATLSPPRPLTEADYRELARKAGFEPAGEFEFKKHHAELLTRNRAGELIELHIDRAGYIYKQKWIR